MLTIAGKLGTAAALVASAASLAAACTASAAPLTSSADRAALLVAPPVSSKVPPSAVETQGPTPTFPGICPLQAFAESVTVCWYDRSTNEQQFVVYKRDLNGNWESVDQVASRDPAGVGDQYQYVDTDRSVSGQCYMIAAANNFGSQDTQEECTVRPDPSQFPLVVPAADKQWYGLSHTNDGTGDLYNGPRGHSLVNAHQTFGVDLAYSESPGLWKIQAQGGPQVMEGEAVALRVWGGGWLAYGNETWGVDLVLSSQPVYQWYVVGDTPGTPIENGEFGLWNSAAGRYLTSGYQTWGVSLNWSSPPGATGATYNASVLLAAQPPVSGYVPFLGYFGGGPGNTTTLTQVSNPTNGPTLYFIKPQDGSSDCGNPSDVIALAGGATLTAAQMKTLYGSATPSLSQRVPFLVCAGTQSSNVWLNLEYFQPQ